MDDLYKHPEDAEWVKGLNLRSEYEERKYKAPFKILPLLDGAFAIQDATGMVICHSWRQGVDAERITEALNAFYDTREICDASPPTDWIK